MVERSRRLTLLVVVLAFTAYVGLTTLATNDTTARDGASSIDVTPAPVPTEQPLTPVGPSDREQARKDAYRPTGVGD